MNTLPGQDVFAALIACGLAVGLLRQTATRVPVTDADILTR